MALLSCDLAVIGGAALFALLLRENFAVSFDELALFMPYAASSMLTGGALLLIFRMHRGIWWLSGLSDYLRLCSISFLLVALSMALGFIGNRLENIPRALPVLQVLLTISGLVGLRVMARLMFSWRNTKAAVLPSTSNLAPGTRTVVLVGLNRLTMLYVRSTEDLAPTQVRIAGIVTGSGELHGRAFGRYPILGTPNNITRIIAELAVHGVFVTHICVMKPRAELSNEDLESLASATQEHGLVIEYFLDQVTGAASANVHAIDSQRRIQGVAAPHARANEEFWQYAQRPYWQVKRAVDVIGSVALICVLAPVFLAVSLVVALDVGLPVIFWQERPGAKGRLFRIYKFRTMRLAFDRDGRRRSDEERVSGVGRALRRSRLDELPQLFNILVGEMSFVGPRPLLPVDQFPGLDARLAIAPGVTGWAQINGGREISAADKAALDLWYLKNASLWIDAQIGFATLRMIFTGEVQNHDAIERAWTCVRVDRQPDRLPEVA